jgi:hypothetical protein
MKHFHLLRLLPLLAFSLIPFLRASASGGDTIVVHTWYKDEYTWPETHQQTFGGFPDGSVPIRKCILRYTLDCAAGGCDPWDVGAPIFVLVPTGGGQYDWFEIGRYITPYARTGVWDFDVTDYLPILTTDSVRLAHRNASYTGGPDGYAVTMDFLFIEGTPPRKPYKVEKLWQGGYQYGNNYVSITPTLTVDTNAAGDTVYQDVWDHFIVYDATTSFDSAIVGSGGSTTNLPFMASMADVNTQILYTAADLIGGGIAAGDLTGIRFNVTTPRSLMRHMTVRMKHSTLTDLASGVEDNTGWTTVYDQFTTLGATGWAPLHFTTPFVWNGTDNVVVSVSFDNDALGGTDAIVSAHTATPEMVAYNNNADYYVSFHDSSSMSIPSAAFTGIDSAITVTFWQYGDLNSLPTNTVVFDARDASNQRVINIHLPWSDLNVYWDCGNSGSGSYDRINKATTTPYDYKGQWNHWAFVKNAVTGEMKVYLNGVLWVSGTGKTRSLSPINSARLGTDVDGNLVCNSKLDEFTVWGAELDSLTIVNWMNRRPDASHPNFADLKVFYPFAEGTGVTVADMSAGGNNATLDPGPDWEGHLREDATLKYPYQISNLRPDAVFEQGVYTSHLDSVVVDSVPVVLLDSIIYYNHFDSTCHPLSVTLDPTFSQVRLKSRTSGHGFGGTDNCAEFCRKLHRIAVDGIDRFTWYNWRDDCGMNASFPQGGTWIYNRAGWCPGSITTTQNFELTPFVSPGGSYTMDYATEAYTWNGAGSVPTWDLANHIVYYETPAFNVNASISDVISPNNQFIQNRFNPICSHPEVTLQNNGITTLTSVDIVYRVTGGADSVYHWTGSLGFLQTVNVTLGGVDWSSGATTFEAFVRNPNGIADEYAIDDTMKTTFNVAPTYPNKVVLFWRTNSKPNETKYTVKNEAGTILYQSSVFLAANDIMRDTLKLNKGCYELRVWDTDGDGLSFFANSDGAGFFRINSGYDGSSLTVLPADFGTQLLVDFRVDSNLVAVDAPVGNPHIDIYPNPTQGELFVDLELEGKSDVDVEVYSVLGVKVREWHFGDKLADVLALDLKGLPAGSYLVNVKTQGQKHSQRIVLTGEGK